MRPASSRTESALIPELPIGTMSVLPIDGPPSQTAVDMDLSQHKGNRVEDRRLITGAGTFAADWNFPGQVHGNFLRSDRAHAEIVSIDIDAALASPGVLAVLTGADAVRAGYVRSPNALNFPGRHGTRALTPERPALAHRTVRFVGEAVALVVASTAAQAIDATELIGVEYAELPVVVDPEETLLPGAPQLHPDVPGNLVFESEAGSEQEVTAALARAAHVTRLKVVVTRVAPSPLEPRACTVAYDPSSGGYTFHVCMQGSTFLRWQMATYTNLPEEKLTFVAQDVGGGFGQRSTAYPEYCALMLAAERLRRPVKWVSTRVEGFVADTHGRNNIVDGTLALDADGRFLALRLDWINDMGAYLSPGAMGHIRNTTACMTGVYRIPASYATFRVPLTNTTPVSAYRGAGRPDAAYAIERLVDAAAFELGLDRTELRRRNFIPPNAFPYKTPTGAVYEIADFPGLLDKALALADWEGYPDRRDASARNGRMRGIGISTVIENTAGGRSPIDEVEIELAEGGTVVVHTVSKSTGNSHETTFAMIVANALELPLDQVKVEQCAPNKRLKGNHTSGSRSTVGAGSACFLAAKEFIRLGRTIAALALGVEPSQVHYASGQFRAADIDRSISLSELSHGRRLTALGSGSFGSTWPNGCHIAEVEIDPQTGHTQIVSYCAVDDCGVIVNHAVVEGQLHGGVVQGAGQVLGEQVVYDRDTGQPLTASFMDYPMPRASLLRALKNESHPTPSAVSPLGVKGMGESGCTGSIPALASAIVDALRPLGIRHIDMPMTPSKLWDAIKAAGNHPG